MALMKQVLRDGRCHLQLFPCLKDRETLCFPFTLHNFPALCVFMKAISIRYIKLHSLQAPLDNLHISPASSLSCWRRSASPACSIAISVSHNTAAPDGRQGNISHQSYHQFSSHQSTSSWEWGIIPWFAWLAHAKDSAHWSCTFFLIQSLGKEKSEASCRYPTWLLSLPPPGMMPNLV